MKNAIAGVMLIALSATSGAAQAHLTPFQGTNRATSGVPHDMTQNFGPASAYFGRDNLQPPPASQAAPEKIGRCTVPILVFTKIRLAQACY